MYPKLLAKKTVSGATSEQINKNFYVCFFFSVADIEKSIVICDEMDNGESRKK